MNVKEELEAIFERTEARSKAEGTAEIYKDLMRSVDSLLQEGRIHQIEGSPQSLALVLDSQCIGHTRSDLGYWQPVLTFASIVKEGDIRVTTLARTKQRFYVGIEQGSSQVMFTSAKKRDEDDISMIKRNLAVVRDYIQKSPNREESVASMGRNVIYAARIQRLHDGLCAVASLRMAHRRYGSGTFVQRDKDNLIDLPDVISSESANFKSFSLDDCLKRQRNPAVSWVEAFSYDQTLVYKEASQMLKEISASGRDADPEVKKSKFKILISYEAEKRVWTQQKDGLIKLVKSLEDSFGEITVLVNGMTGYAGSSPEETTHLFPSIVEAESDFINLIAASTNKTTAIHLSGLSVAEKASALRGVDFFTAPAVSAAMIPMLMDVPGVIYGNSAMTEILKSRDVESIFPVKFVPDNIVSYDDTENGHVNYSWASGTKQSASYRISPNKFSKLCLDAIKMT
ncbi:hypothetical protein [Salipiger aestuarii]|uniref:hypothetical protein n=1 Tax=Salipiger aestuarii TaxID=568098 RepID=UPI00123A41BD|nr:hypothetical protein [Salipiger aestuarii]KAA8610000.1 hypothetical protein AL037_14175 [Salipiger aestuarii]